MNRFTAKLVHGFARLAFWRKPVETAPEQSQSPDPATARRLRTAEAEPSVSVDVPVLRAGWFARLKQVLRRRRDSAQEPSLDPDQTGVRAHPSKNQVEENAAANVVPLPKLSFLGWLKNKLRRQPKPEQLEADVDADALKPGAEENSKATASSDANPDDDADAVQISRIRRALSMLSNKWVWVPSVSIVLLAIIVSMLLMLLQSAQEKKQLQTKLIATQKKLEQTSIVKQAAARKNLSGQAGDPASETLAADTQPGVDAGDCVVTDKESVIKTLKNCIDSFNNDMAQ